MISPCASKSSFARPCGGKSRSRSPFYSGLAPEATPRKGPISTKPGTRCSKRSFETLSSFMSARAATLVVGLAQAIATLETDRPWYERMRDAFLLRIAEKGL